jgi:hypothetical protein
MTRAVIVRLTKGIRCDVTHGWSIAGSVTFASHLLLPHRRRSGGWGRYLPDASQWIGE